MQNYYILTEETKINTFGIKLYRIKCTRAFQDIKVGDLGGWISQDAEVSGNAWIYEDAEVSGNAKVYGNAKVFGNAKVYGKAKVYGNATVSGDSEVSLILN